MATQSALPAINTLLQYGNGGSPEVFTTIANVGDIPGPSMSATKVKTTSHSTGNPWGTSIPTVLEAGEAGVPVFYVAGSVTHLFLLNEFRTRTIRNWRVTWPGTGNPTPANDLYFQCEGYISGFKFDSPVEGVQKATVQWTWTGQPIIPTTGTPEF